MSVNGMVVGRVFGIEIRASRSWVVILLLVTLIMASQLDAIPERTWSQTVSVLGGAVAAVLFFVSVVAHELAHCLAARRFGIEARSIQLNFFGGLSWLSRQARRPVEEFIISVSGPIANVALAAVFIAIGLGLGEAAGIASPVATKVGVVNIILAAFNMIPGFPLDGGRALRAVIWGMTKSYEKGTLWASLAGQGIAAFFMMAGLAWVFASGIDGLWLLIIGYYLFTRARGSLGELALRRALKGLTIGNMWLDTLPEVERSTTLADFLRDLAPGTDTASDPHFMVVEEGVIWGMLPASRVLRVDSRVWDATRVGEVMTPIDKIEKLTYQTEVLRALEAMYASDVRELPVIEENQVQGFVGMDSLLRFVASRMTSENGRPA
jgi:Zn-dependent protease